MKIKNSELENLSAGALNCLLSKELPVELSFRIAQMIKTIQPHIEVYYQEKMKIVNKYCEKDDKGNPKTMNEQYLFSGKNKELFLAQFNVLLNLNVGLPNFKKVTIKLSDFKDSLQLSIRDILALESIIKFEVGDKNGKNNIL